MSAKVRITGGPTPFDVKVILVEDDGRETLIPCSFVSFQIDPRQPLKAQIEVFVKDLGVDVALERVEIAKREAS